MSVPETECMWMCMKTQVGLHVIVHKDACESVYERKCM